MLSVVICTHNPRPDYFPRCLNALRSQTLSPDLWELVVVDNRSDGPGVERIDLSWHLTARIVREESSASLLPACAASARRRENCWSSWMTTMCLTPISSKLPFALRKRSRSWDLGVDNAGLDSRNRLRNGPVVTGEICVIREFDKMSGPTCPDCPTRCLAAAGLCVRRDVALHYLHLHESGKRSFQFDRTGGP